MLRHAERAYYFISQRDGTRHPDKSGLRNGKLQQRLHKEFVGNAELRSLASEVRKSYIFRIHYALYLFYCNQRVLARR